MNALSQPAAGASGPGNPFWQFSLRLYRVPGVAPACLRLQDEAGADVNVLFFLLWNASRGARLSAADIAVVDRHVAPWREAAVKPLRAVRRSLKDDGVLQDAAAADAFRTRVKGLELEAERLQQEALYGLAQTDLVATLQPGRAGPDDAASAHIASYQVFCGTPFPADAVITIRNAFKSLVDADASTAGVRQNEG
jgi:uncharacterized protein (TIGR02444 family)